ncbi:MAG: hypothetical protein QMD61_00580 [Methanobacterium sp.]|nr:hypothetical protein [Methanobacterium sp.]
MREEITHSKTIVEQILNEMMLKLENHEDFDPDTLIEIKKLIKEGKFNNINPILEVLSRCEE